MDYATKAVSRHDLRKYAKIIRNLFCVSQTGRFPVLEILDRIPEVFTGSYYQIVADKELKPKVMAQCEPNVDGGFTIKIKESVYRGAYEHDIGAFRGFICHEICHIFLFEIGYKPIYARSMTDEIPAYCSVEWQAKALCAEVMIPFEESRNMKKAEIIDKYHVSKAFATKRRRLDKKER